MSVMTYTREIPRLVTGAYLRAARVPVSAVGRLTGQRDNEQWGPAIAFESFEAGVESVVGTVLRDDTLLDSAKLRRAKVDQLRQAGNLEAVAEQKRRQADETFNARRQQAEQKRQQAAKQAKQREESLEQRAAEKERQANQKAAKKAAAARQTKAKQDEVIERQERAAKLSALEAESQALGKAKEAVDAEKTVDVIDETLEGQKEARKSG
jgi:hypothetical protein